MGGGVLFVGVARVSGREGRQGWRIGLQDGLKGTPSGCPQLRCLFHMCSCAAVADWRWLLVVGCAAGSGVLRCPLSARSPATNLPIPTGRRYCWRSHKPLHVGWRQAGVVGTPTTLRQAGVALLPLQQGVWSLSGCCFHACGVAVCVSRSVRTSANALIAPPEARRGAGRAPLLLLPTCCVWRCYADMRDEQ